MGESKIFSHLIDPFNGVQLDEECPKDTIKSFLSEPVITIELDERYFEKLKLTKAVVQKLQEEGKKSEFVSKDIITIEGFKYQVKEKMELGMVPVQVALLRKIEKTA